MKVFYDAIYLSPHLDDVALSCGGQIFGLTQNGHPVLIVTIMAGTPTSNNPSQYAQSLHQRWELNQDVVESRKSEDIAACKILGADWQHWDFLDCIYRTHPQTKEPLYTSDEEIFGRIHPAESSLINSIASQLAQLPASNRLFAPLTLGHHVDHQLTRLAAEKIFPVPKNLLYYEDYPYAQHHSGEQLIAQETGVWVRDLVILNESSITARINSIKCFKSQLSTFFTSEEDLEKQIRSCISQTGGEKSWIQLQD